MGTALFFSRSFKVCDLGQVNFSCLLISSFTPPQSRDYIIIISTSRVVLSVQENNILKHLTHHFCCCYYCCFTTVVVIVCLVVTPQNQSYHQTWGLASVVFQRFMPPSSLNKFSLSQTVPFGTLSDRPEMYIVN